MDDVERRIMGIRRLRSVDGVENDVGLTLAGVATRASASRDV